MMLLLASITSVSQEPHNPEVSKVRPAILDVADERMNAVVRIHAIALDGTESYGTGFLVTGDGVVLTSASVMSSVKVVNVSRFGDTYPADILFSGSEPDSVAILQTKLQGQKLRIANHEPNLKDQVSAIGWESAPEPRLSSDVGSIVGIVGDKIYYSRSSEGRPGFGGGPLINEQGDVIGLHVGKLFGTNTAWALNLRSQLPILKKFGILSEDMTTDASVLSSVGVGCDAVDERSQSVDFHLTPDQQIVDVTAQIAEQSHVAAAKVSIERVSGSMVTIHSWIQGQSRHSILGISVAPCDTGHVSILIHVRATKSGIKP
jgi:S1-C subfamily serine protease